MTEKAKRLLQGNHFLYLLPVYFVLHGYVDNLQAMHFTEALALMARYVAAALLLTGLSFFLFKSWGKAALFAFALLFFHLFFGPLHDGFRRLLPGSFLVQYSVVLPASVLYFILLFAYLRKTDRPLRSTRLYINLVFLLVLLIEVPRWAQAAAAAKSPAPLPGTAVCDTCDRPDVYLIIADEYADSVSLQQVFGFNNGAFQSALRDRGFHVLDSSRSNYNYTPFAVASLVQMNYLQGIKERNQSLSDKNVCYRAINESPLWDFFRRQGYEVRNHSVFNVANVPTRAPQNYILIGRDQVTANTFLSRLDRDLRYHLASDLKIPSEVERVTQFMNRCNRLLMEGLLNDLEKPSGKPTFVYTHLTMPHYPYYYRKDGTPNPPELLTEGAQVRKPEYIGYLQYSNGVFLNVIDRILAASKKPPVILFMGDHGFREFSSGFEENKRFYYMNLNAVLLPSRNYEGFYEGISSVNQFRVLLNGVFAQNLPLLKDSSILIYE